MNRIITNWPKIPGTVAVHDIMTFDYQSNDILWVCDTLKSECLDSLKKQGNLPMFIVGDNASAINHRDFSVYTTPFRGLELEFIKFQHLNFEDTVNDTRHCFNWRRVFNDDWWRK